MRLIIRSVTVPSELAHLQSQIVWKLRQESLNSKSAWAS